MITAAQQSQSCSGSAEMTVGSHQEKRKLLHLCFIDVCLTNDIGISYFIIDSVVHLCLDEKLCQFSKRCFYKMLHLSKAFLWMVNQSNQLTNGANDDVVPSGISTLSPCVLQKPQSTELLPFSTLLFTRQPSMRVKIK